MLRLCFLGILTSAVLAGKKWTESGVEIEITKAIPHDKCKQAFRRDRVHQFYTLKLKDGRLVHSNEGGQPFIFRLGMGEVVKGMDIAMAGMCEGEERKAVIPAALGYGKAGNKDFEIPGDSTLYFDIRLTKIEEAPHLWMDTGVEIEVTKKVPESECKWAEPGDTLHQYYTVKLDNGTLVDSNEGKQPFIFRLDNGQVIKGMDIAMRYMCEGEKRRVIIPWELAYGEEGDPPEVPPKADLYFDIELRKLVKERFEL